MEFKDYQKTVIAEVGAYLSEVAKEDAAGNRHAALDAWDKLRVPGRPYREQRNGLGKAFPQFCLKVPTGGGKTLLATQVLGLMHSTILKVRNGCGLVLWVVPSDQIYKDTLRALRDRNHFYRFSLEHAVSRRVEVWEKTDIMRITPTQLSSTLNVLLLIKASITAKEDKREGRRVFRDSGGNIVMHFPPENEPAAHKALKARFPNLEMLVDDEAQGEHLAKTSLGNLIRICEPPIILDEGHKAYSHLAMEMLSNCNASVVVELSATPHNDANVLCRVTGEQLLKEAMIKLPINICNSNDGRWQDCLAKAKTKREGLEAKAVKRQQEGGRYIRPIVLVQVERTGKDQREDGKVIHSQQVKEYLMQRLGVSEAEIAIKTSDQDDFEKERIKLLEEGCRTNWIITKAALQEGWDCPFAYILVSLNNTGRSQTMTQLIGRVLRQPYVEKAPVPEYAELNESYVYCLRQKADTIARDVKAALEKEGYEGSDSSVVDKSGDARKSEPTQQSFFRPAFQPIYKPFDGRIYLPRFCVRDEADQYEPLDYFRHLISQVDVEAFDYKNGVKWQLSDEMEKAKDFLYRATLGQKELEKVGQSDAEHWESDERVLSWLVANLPYDHFSFKQLRVIVECAAARLLASNTTLKDHLGLVRFTIRNKLREFIEAETDRLAESAFATLHTSGRLCFYLECVKCRFEIPSSVEIRRTEPLRHEDWGDVQRSLFDYVPKADFNDYERKVALVIDRHPEVLWWYRNKVGAENFWVQGFKKGRIYPDFVTQNGSDDKPTARVVVVESKGQHLEGNRDTNYKKKIADYFEKVGREVSWQELGEGFDKQQFRFQVLDEGVFDNWRGELEKVLAIKT